MKTRKYIYKKTGEVWQKVSRTSHFQLKRRIFIQLERAETEIYISKMAAKLKYKRTWITSMGERSQLISLLPQTPSFSLVATVKGAQA
jgi:hypothetical protein